MQEVDIKNYNFQFILLTFLFRAPNFHSKLLLQDFCSCDLAWWCQTYHIATHTHTHTHTHTLSLSHTHTNTILPPLFTKNLFSYHTTIWLRHRHEQRQTDRQTDWLTDRQTDRQTNWQTDRLTEKPLLSAVPVYRVASSFPVYIPRGNRESLQAISILRQGKSKTDISAGLLICIKILLSKEKGIYELLKL